jgi:NAD(P)-dependent dehydrogenase (short-subunit alcohol dehydrogenase family)
MLVAFVTGAARGIAIGLTSAGFKVFATGRSTDSADLPASVERIRCDHMNDDEKAHGFARVAETAGVLGCARQFRLGWIRANVRERRIHLDLAFLATAGAPVASVMDACVRAAFIATSGGARLMAPRRSGLIVNISRFGWLAGPSNSESPEFIGRLIAALSVDPNLMQRSGRALIAATLDRLSNDGHVAISRVALVPGEDAAFAAFRERSRYFYEKPINWLNR